MNAQEEQWEKNRFFNQYNDMLKTQTKYCPMCRQKQIYQYLHGVVTFFCPDRECKGNAFWSNDVLDFVGVGVVGKDEQ